MNNECPRCCSTKLVMEKSPNGSTRCAECGYEASHKDWKIAQLEKEVADLKAKLESKNSRRKRYLLKFKGTEDDYVYQGPDKISIAARVTRSMATRFRKGDATLFKGINESVKLEVIEL